MKRRQLLGTTAALLVPIAGCLDAGDPSNDDTSGNESPSNLDEENTTDESSAEYDPAERVDPLYVHNLTPDTVTVGVEIVHVETEDVILQKTYRVPPGYGARAPDLREVGELYRVRAKHDGTEAEVTSKSPSCEKVGMDTAPGEQTPFDVRIFTDGSGETGISIGGSSCDEDSTRAEHEYENHAEFVVDDASGFGASNR